MKRREILKALGAALAYAATPPVLVAAAARVDEKKTGMGFNLATGEAWGCNVQCLGNGWYKVWAEVTPSDDGPVMPVAFVEPEGFGPGKASEVAEAYNLDVHLASFRLMSDPSKVKVTHISHAGVYPVRDNSEPVLTHDV